jgi:hypothetical protein
MGHYYFAAIALPELSLQQPPEISFGELDLLFSENLSAADYRQACRLRRYFDIENLRAYWQEVPFNHYGYYALTDLEEALLEGTFLQPYGVEFLQQYGDRPQRLNHLPQLCADYYRYEIAHAKGFAKQWLSFERAVRLLQQCHRALQLDRDLHVELEHEDHHEPLVQQLMAQRSCRALLFPEPFEELAAILSDNSKRPLSLYCAFNRYRFDHAAALAERYSPFSLERLLAYMVQLWIAEQWHQLDQQRGLEQINRYIHSALE